MPASSPLDLENSVVERNVAVDSVKYRQLFPWLRIFDLFWIAIDLQKIILAAAAVLLLAGGDWAFQSLPFAPRHATELTRHHEPVLGETLTNWPWQQPVPHHLRASQNNGTTFRTSAEALRLILSPIETLVRPARVLFRTDATWPQLAMAWTQILWALIVSAIFGGAITRIAAVQIGSDRKLGLVGGLKFSLGRFLSFFGAPLLPMMGMGLLWGLCLLGGFVGRIPGGGPWVVGLFWGIALLFGFLMALILIGAATGWPLMFATISVEGSDALDGLSRSYGYVYAKPWYYGWLLGIAVVYGQIAIIFVAFVASLSRYLAVWAVSWGMGRTDMADNPLTAFWINVVGVFVVSFVFSYFWSATTMIYYLLRRSIDANDFSEVHLEEEPVDELHPLEMPHPPSEPGGESA